MLRTHLACRLGCLAGVALAWSLLTCQRAGGAEIPADVAGRIAAVESGLISPVRIKGRAPGKLSERMQALAVPAVSVAVINNYQVEWAKAYGVADATTQSPATTATRFQAASMSKPIAAMAVLTLVEKELVDLDRDVNAQLKSWQVPENEFTRQHAVDLRGIMSHTAGLTVHGFPGYAVGAPLPTVPEILDGKKPANTPAVRVDKVPGRGFRYSGGGTTVMQLLVGDVTGRPFPEFMRDTLLAPLGMSQSTYQQPLPGDLQSMAASAHDRQGKPVVGRWHVYPEMAPAGLWATPSDVARYVIEVQLAHEGRSAKVLKRETIEAMLTPQNGGPVGLGPFLHEENGERRFEHSGGNKGFACNFVGLLDHGQGAVVMTNSDAGGRVVQELFGAIATVYAWPNFLAPEREPAKIDAAVLDRYVGRYDLALLGEAEIERRGERLFAISRLGADLELFFESDTTFVTESPDVTGRFVVDNGKVVEMVVKLGEQQMRAKRKD